MRPPWKAGAHRTEEARELSWEVWTRRRGFDCNVKIRYERTQQEENLGRVEKEESRYLYIDSLFTDSSPVCLTRVRGALPDPHKSGFSGISQETSSVVEHQEAIQALENH